MAAVLRSLRRPLATAAFASWMLIGASARADDPAPDGAKQTVSERPTTEVDSKASIAVAVDDRVTLLSIVARLSGAAEYNDARTKSPYADAVDRHFKPFREHRVVGLFRDLRARSGVSYDAPMSLACHLGALPALEERIDLSTRPERLDARWTPAETRAFLVALRDFVRDAGVVEFLATQRSYENAARARLAGALDGAAQRAWCDGFFGARDGAVFEVRLGLLTGPHNYGVGIRFPEPTTGATARMAEEITPVIGCWQWDAVQGLPTWPKGALESLVVHELCHSYVNTAVDRAWAVLEPPSRRLFAMQEKRMRAQAYATARIVCYETVVRACVVRYFRSRAGERGESLAKKAEVREGFTWVPAVADALARFEALPPETRDFEVWIAELAPVLAAEADRLTPAP